jgi:hypothetical protein
LINVAPGGGKPQIKLGEGLIIDKTKRILKECTQELSTEHSALALWDQIKGVDGVELEDEAPDSDDSGMY